jgi:3-methyladenine DNA glycosylase/8-oxoguanine DNA glycosylase
METDLSDSADWHFSLPYQLPYDFQSLLLYFKKHGIPGSEVVECDSYTRVAFETNNGAIKAKRLTVSQNSEENALTVVFSEYSKVEIEPTLNRISSMFGLMLDLKRVETFFSASKFLSPLFASHPGLRVPKGWDAFEVAISTVLGQFVSIQQGQNLLRQLVENYGTHVRDAILFPSPEVLAGSDLSAVKTTAIRKKAIRELGQKTLDGYLKWDGTQDKVDFRNELLKTHGIGPWTVEYICLFGLGDIDAWPEKDLIITRALRMFPGIMEETLSPYRAFLAILLWKEFSTSLQKKAN